MRSFFNFQSTWYERKPSMDLFNRTVVPYFTQNYSNQEIPFEKPEVNDIEGNTGYSKFNSVPSILHIKLIINCFKYDR